ncbi:hypothetical protein QBC38DRAFT_504086 [Podospora fimiseda]|uniref:Uncharacterized protein n=1 Tax=Podospora fimiseda TaxID=252190 RepID=A0AAN6YQQ5_9PEZI|nr:hypothetical protein QBC38DRAFT_504086 [Podospora fimiseda]
MDIEDFEAKYNNINNSMDYGIGPVSTGIQDADNFESLDDIGALAQHANNIERLDIDTLAQQALTILTLGQSVGLRAAEQQRRQHGRGPGLIHGPSPYLYPDLMLIPSSPKRYLSPVRIASQHDANVVKSDANGVKSGANDV